MYTRTCTHVCTQPYYTPVDPPNQGQHKFSFHKGSNYVWDLEQCPLFRGRLLCIKSEHCPLFRGLLLHTYIYLRTLMVKFVSLLLPVLTVFEYRDDGQCKNDEHYEHCNRDGYEDDPIGGDGRKLG